MIVNREQKQALRAAVHAVSKEGGWRMRYALLAYAFERGVPYRVLERTTGEHNEPKVSLVLNSRHATLFAAGLVTTGEESPEEYDLRVARVREWLNQPALPTPKPAREHEALFSTSFKPRLDCEPVRPSVGQWFRSAWEVVKVWFELRRAV